MPTAAMNLIISKLQVTLHMNNSFSDKTTGPREASKASLNMSIIWLPCETKNALKQQVIATSLGKVLVYKKDEQLVSVARQLNY